jgi:HlyD family secretion protein
MKEKSILFFKNNIKRKRTWIIAGVVLIIIGYFIFRPVNNSKNIVSEISSYIDLKQTVLATGQVTSETDLSLSFNSSGVVKSIKVKVGDNVKEGTVLATLDQGSELAILTSARGAFASAQARLARTIEGASTEEVTLSQIALDNAKRSYEDTKSTQETLVKNAYFNLLNSTPEAVPDNGTSDYIAPIISGNYNLGKEGTIKLTSYYSVGGTSFTASGLTTGSGIANSITAQPLGDSGLYIKFPSTTNINVTDWVINIPNKKASNYLANYNTYQSALKTQESALSSASSLVDQRNAELSLKKAGARSSDIDLAKADILSAQGQLEGAQAKYDNTIIKAPSTGTITKIDIKIGELTSALKEAIVLQDVSNIYIETNINEANITSLSLGMPIDITFDSFGPDKIFKGNITKIDPASTLVSGVVNYKVTASVEKVPDLRPGMTANMTIKAKEKNHVLTLPSRAILVNKDGSKNIRLITNTKLKSYKEVPITTGLEGDGGLIEVTSGLSEGDEYVVLIKK